MELRYFFIFHRPLAVEDESADSFENMEKILLFHDASKPPGSERDIENEIRIVSFIEGVVDFSKSYGRGLGAGD
jgi:hypothetical protein